MKKISLYIISFFIVLSLTNTIYAQETLSQKDTDNTNYIEIENIDNYQIISTLYEIDKYGNERPIGGLIDVDYSIKDDDISSIKIKASTTKSSSDKKQNNGVTLTGTINWIDVVGTNNILKSVSGTCTGNVEYNSYAYGTGPRFLNTTWHSAANFGTSFYDARNAGRTANSFVLQITARPVGKSNFVLRVCTKITD